MRTLGVDYGERRIGLALSDEDGRLALPFKTVDAPGRVEAARAVAEEAKTAGAGAVVVGLPLHLDGSEGTAARRARRFAAEVDKRVDVPVVLWDERLTTAAAERSLDALAVRGPRRRRVVDQSAAALLLQGYLDAKAGRSWDEQDEDEPEPESGGDPPVRRGRSRGR